MVAYEIKGYLHAVVVFVKEDRSGGTVERPQKLQNTDLVGLFWLPAGWWIL